MGTVTGQKPEWVTDCTLYSYYIRQSLLHFFTYWQGDIFKVSVIRRDILLWDIMLFWFILLAHAEGRLTFDCEHQIGGDDCDLFAIAFSTALCFDLGSLQFRSGLPPVPIWAPSSSDLGSLQFRFDQHCMRQHLLHCYNNDHLTSFPSSPRRINKAIKVKRFVEIWRICRSTMDGDTIRCDGHISDHEISTVSRYQRELSAHENHSCLRIVSTCGHIFHSIHGFTYFLSI